MEVVVLELEFKLGLHFQLCARSGILADDFFFF